MSELRKAPWSEWETVRLIGRGSFGTVYEIQRKLVDEDTEAAALKIITIPQNSEDIEEMYSEGFDNESITATFNSHLKSIIAEYSLMRKMDGSANIVNCKDIRYIQHDDGIGWDIYIRMELLTPLMKALPIDAPEDVAVQVGRDICNALVLCKKHGIVHRDIKPQNIFVSPNGDYKLGDFGIAKTVEKTMGGTKIGTYKYMAPEVYNNQPYGSGADIYSLGLVLYWLLNERRMPFMPLPPAKLKAGQDEESRHRRLSGEPLPPPVHGSDELKRVVLKACAYDPKDRYASAIAMLDDLNSLSGRALSSSAVIVHRSNTEVGQEADLTTGPFLGREQRQNGIISGIPGSDETVGPSFKNKAMQTKEYAVGAQCTSSQKAGIPGRKEEAHISGIGLSTELNGEKEGIYPPPNPIAPQQIEQEKKSKKGLVAIIAACLALALLLCLVIPQFRKDGPEDDISLQASTTTTKNTTVPTTTAPTTAKTTAAETEATEAEPSETESTETEPTETEPPKETLPVQLEWSGWSQNLPDYVTAENYFVEERTLYSSRKLETKSSTDTSYIDGWEMYNTAAGKGDFGAWSDWSTNAVSKSENRDVQTETRYRYSNKETTTSSSSSMSGWEWYNTTYSWSDYGSWSDWIASAFYASDSRKVETLTQYRYRDISYSTEYTSWGGWSDWQDSYVSESDLTNVETRTAYHYYYFICSKCGKHLPGQNLCYSWDGGCGRSGTGGSYTTLRLTTPYSSTSDFGGVGMRYITVNGDKVFAYTSSSSPYYVAPITQYRYRTRSTYQEAHYGNWSSWSNSPYSGSSTREVETRTVYRYCDRTQIATYHFYRWGNWSGWSTNAVSSNNDRKVETATFYRYRDRVNQTTYYFRRWTNWSDYSTNYVAASDTVQVETKTEYRFKSK